MLISHVYRFIYLKTIKTGGTSVEIYFEPYCADPARCLPPAHERDQEISRWGIIGSRLRPSDARTWRNHLPASEIRARIGAEMWKDYFKFCVIRNPFDKVVSLFWHELSLLNRAQLQRLPFAVVRKVFLDWIRNADLRLDRTIFTIAGSPAVDRFVRYESLSSDIEDVCRHLVLPWEPSKLGRYKANSRCRNEHVSLYHDAASASRVRRSYQWELDYFGYSQD
jgi:hypothetical protein